MEKLLYNLQEHLTTAQYWIQKQIVFDSNDESRWILQTQSVFIYSEQKVYWKMCTNRIDRNDNKKNILWFFFLFSFLQFDSFFNFRIAYMSFRMNFDDKVSMILRFVFTSSLSLQKTHFELMCVDVFVSAHFDCFSKLDFVKSRVQCFISVCFIAHNHFCECIFCYEFIFSLFFLWFTKNVRPLSMAGKKIPREGSEWNFHSVLLNENKNIN